MDSRQPKQSIVRKGVIVFCVVLSLLLAIGVYFFQENSNQHDIENIQTIYSVRIESLLNRVFHQTDVLKTLVEIEGGNITEEQFETAAQSIYEQNIGVRAVQCLPGGTVLYCYPTEGNEPTFGNNVFNNPNRAQDAWLAVDTHSIALSGPYELTQGGIGCVARNPIFLTNEEGQEYFWGFSVIVLDLEKTMDAEGINQLGSQGYDFQLRTVTDNGDTVIVAGDASMDLGGAVESDIQVPHHIWTLALKSNTPYKSLILSLSVFALGLLLTLLVGYSYRISLLKAQNEAKSQFLSNMSHHMRTPLNAIIGFSILGEDEARDMQQKKYFRAIKDSGGVLLYLVENILSATKGEQQISPLEPKSGDLNDLFDSVCRMVPAIDRPKQVLWCAINELPKNVSAQMDYSKLTQVCLEMVDRAFGFASIGETVSFAMGLSDSEHVVVVVEVGPAATPGIVSRATAALSNKEDDSSDAEGVLYAFEYPDSGFGLPHAKQLVAAMQGTIKRVHTPGGGDCVIAVIPIVGGEGGGDSEDDNAHAFSGAADDGVCDEEALDFSVPSASSSAFVQLSGKRVLVVEDQPINQMIVVRLLEKAGIVAECASDGKQAMDMMAASDEGHFDTIIMDIRMPVMDGLEAAKGIRALPREDAPRIAIIALSANAFDEDAQMSLDAGMDAHLSKPIDPQTLYRVLVQHIGEAK